MTASELSLNIAAVPENAVAALASFENVGQSKVSSFTQLRDFVVNAEQRNVPDEPNT